MKDRFAAMSADQRKKLYVLLGLSGLLAVTLLVFFNPFGGSAPATPPIGAVPVAGNSAQNAANTPGASAPVSTVGAVPGTAPVVPVPVGGAAAGGAPAVGATLVGVSAGPGAASRLVKSRPDPFEPFYSPTPTPLPTPLPPPPTLPPPLALPSPDGGLPPASIPGLPVARGNTANTVLAALPPVRFAGSQPDTPRVVQPPPLNREGGSQGPVERSPNKRLSGVIIGNTVRALLEITDENGDKVTRVVQPGDEVDGVQVLRIERFTQNGQLTTRMFLREGGQERYVDLRADPTADTSSAGGGGGGARGGGGAGARGGGGGGGGGAGARGGNDARR